MDVNAFDDIAAKRHASILGRRASGSVYRDKYPCYYPESFAEKRPVKNLVIAEFPARKDKVEEVKAAFGGALKDTRAFDGCISIDVYFEEATSTFTAIQDWESFDHYDRYLNWRMESGLADLLDPLLDGGVSSMSVRKFKNLGF